MCIRDSAWALAIGAAEYVLKMLPRGTHEFDRLIRPSELARWARQSSLVLEGSSGLEHNPFTGRYWLSDDTRVNYMLATRREQA